MPPENTTRQQQPLRVHQGRLQHRSLWRPRAPWQDLSDGIILGYEFATLRLVQVLCSDAGAAGPKGAVSGG